MATLIVVTSVMSGFQTEIVNRFLGVNGHITVAAFAGQKIDGYDDLVKRIRALPGVSMATATQATRANGSTASNDRGFLTP